MFPAQGGCWEQAATAAVPFSLQMGKLRPWRQSGCREPGPCLACSTAGLACHQGLVGTFQDRGLVSVPQMTATQQTHPSQVRLALHVYKCIQVTHMPLGPWAPSPYCVLINHSQPEPARSALQQASRGQPGLSICTTYRAWTWRQTGERGTHTVP